MNNLFARYALSFLSLSTLFSSPITALQEARQPSGLDFPSYKFAWFFSSDKDQNQAIYKAVTSLAYEKLLRSQTSYNKFIEDKLKNINELSVKKFLESVDKSNRSYEKAFIVLANTDALKKWAEGYSFDKLVKSPSSYDEIDQPLLGTLKYVYFTHPKTIAFPYQGDWFFASNEEIKAIVQSLKSLSKSTNSSDSSSFKNFTFKPEESKESLSNLYSLILPDTQSQFLKTLDLLSHLKDNIDGDTFAVFYSYNYKQDLSPDYQKNINEIENKYKVISRYIKRSGVLEESNTKDRSSS